MRILDKRGDISYLEYNLRTDDKSADKSNTIADPAQISTSSGEECSEILRVLLVEDNPPEARLVEEYLEIKTSKKFSLDLAENLNAAKLLLSENSYDALLLDLGLPDSKDLATFSDIIHIVPDAAIIILSGNDDPHVAMKALELGAQDFIPKNSLNDELLKKTLFYAVQRQRLRRSLNESRVKADAGNKAKNEFLAMMSHELRTPLNAVLGGLQLIKKKERISECGQFIELVDNGLNSLISMIDQILDVSEIESTKVYPENHKCSIKDLVEELAKCYTTRAEEKNIELNFNIEAKTPETIITDQNRLLRVLKHLLDNALKFTGKGRIQFRVHCTDSASFHFEIEDTGVGISPTFMNHIYQPFSQEDSSTTRRFGGAGLGLAICKSVCDTMNWSLRCDSEKNAGTLFCLTLHGESNESETKPIRTYIPQHVSPESRKNLAAELPLKILLAEDCFANQKIINMILQSMGYQLDIVKDGYEAVAASEEKEFDLILMDIAMPNMDGICATNVIKYQAHKKDKKQPYIAAVTATVSISEQKKCLDVGMQAFLTKPVKIDELVCVIEEAHQMRSSST